MTTVFYLQPLLRCREATPQLGPLFLIYANVSHKMTLVSSDFYFQ